MAASVMERFMAKVDKNGPIPAHRPDLGPCWVWTASTDGQKRYGSIQYEGKLHRAHHVAHRLLVGPCPDGLEWDHLCRVTLCVRPSHGEWVTHAENVLRGESLQAKNARKTHCDNGHEFTPENTLRKNGGKHRACRKCAKASYERNREQYNANRVAKRRAQRPPINRTYSEQERREAIALAEQVGTPQAAQTLGIPYATVNVWVWKARKAEQKEQAA